MPQLETSTWFITIISSSITLFMIMQLKINSLNFFLSPTAKALNIKKPENSWESKWTKIYLPLLLPQQ